MHVCTVVTIIITMYVLGPWLPCNSVARDFMVICNDFHLLSLYSLADSLWRPFEYHYNYVFIYQMHCTYT